MTNHRTHRLYFARVWSGKHVVAYYGGAVNTALAFQKTALLADQTDQPRGGVEFERVG
jgi:hypothetical protein